MKRIWIVAALTALFAPAAGAQEGSVVQRLENALAFEWFYSKCEQAEQASGMMLVSAGMIIAAHTVHDLEAARRRIRDGIVERFPDPAAACEDYSNYLRQQQ